MAVGAVASNGTRLSSRVVMRRRRPCSPDGLLFARRSAAPTTVQHQRVALPRQESFLVTIQATTHLGAATDDACDRQRILVRDALSDRLLG